MSERRSVWNAVGLVATLGLAALVAVVAVGRSDQTANPAESLSPSPSPSASVSASPGTLQGQGPYVVYASDTHVFAYDLATGRSMSLGSLGGEPARERSRQPDAGRLVAFPTAGGDVWTVTRAGLKRVGSIPTPNEGLDGSALSLDERRMAVATLASPGSIVVVDVQTGRSTRLERLRRGEYPPESLLPVAWGLGGTVVYAIPHCPGCDGVRTGLYAVDVTSGSSTRVQGTSATGFITFPVSRSGQALYYGTGTTRRCESRETPPCEGPPYFLRRLAAGRRGSEVIRRATDRSLLPEAISQDDRILLVRRPPERGEGGSARLELYSTEGDLEASLRGIPAGTLRGVALLPRDIVLIEVNVLAETASLRVGEQGRTRTIVTGADWVYLGWLL